MKTLVKLAAGLVAGVVLAGGVAAAFGAEWGRGEDERETMRIAMLSDGGSFSDQSYNQSCREGLEELMFTGAPVYVQFYEPLAEEQFAKQMAALAERNYRVIIGIGYGMSKALGQVAKQYPKTFFVGVDSVDVELQDNIQLLAFQVDECAFPAGYLAAAWAVSKDPEDPVVGWVGGKDVDSVNQFLVAYVNGVKLYNERKGQNVRVVGGYAGSFTRAASGGTAARKAVKAGADVIFAVAGAAGRGALEATKAAGKWAIGVDTDQFYMVPEADDILLTSCVKRMGRAVRDNIQGMLEGQFWGGTTYVGNLENHGIGLAPFHHFEKDIPEELRRELLDIQRDILNGRLSTGWAPGTGVPVEAGGTGGAAGTARIEGCGAVEE